MVLSFSGATGTTFAVYKLGIWRGWSVASSPRTGYYMLQSLIFKNHCLSTSDSNSHKFCVGQFMFFGLYKFGGWDRFIGQFLWFYHIVFDIKILMNFELVNWCFLAWISLVVGIGLLDNFSDFITMSLTSKFSWILCWLIHVFWLG